MSAPAVADLATQQNWASEFLDASTTNAAQRDPESHKWTEQFLAARTPASGHIADAHIPVESTQWAKDFLASNEHKEWYVQVVLSTFSVVSL